MIKFNGQRWASSELDILKDKVNLLKRDHDLTPHLVSILVGDDKSLKFYTNLKRQKATQIGAKFTIKIFEENEKPLNIINFINKCNEDNEIHGIMIQMPLPSKQAKNKDNYIEAIAPQKDVDGLKIKSDFMHPTAKAIYQILTQVLTINKNTKLLLIGSNGMVGSSLSMLLRINNINFTGIDIEDDLENHTKKADIIISATGHPNLINANMVKKGVSLIDVGYPKGDVNKKSVANKAKFITPVPGGVGPLTITILLDNLIASAEKTLQNNPPQE